MRQTLNAVIFLLASAQLHVCDEDANFSHYHRQDFLKLCKRNEALDIGTTPTLLEFDFVKFGVFYRSCHLELKTRRGLGFSVLVYEMDFSTNCDEEHITIRSHAPKKQIVSEKICGNLTAAHFDQVTFHEAESSSILISYERDVSFRRNSSFLMVLTPMATNCGRNSGLFFRCGNDTTRTAEQNCLPRSVLCDGIRNCILPDTEGFDEIGCQRSSVKPGLPQSMRETL